MYSQLVEISKILSGVANTTVVASKLVDFIMVCKLFSDLNEFVAIIIIFICLTPIQI